MVLTFCTLILLICTSSQTNSLIIRQDNLGCPRFPFKRVYISMTSIMTDKKDAPLLSLQAEFANLAYAVTIQDDDEIFKTIYDRSWASDVVEM